MEVCRTPWNGEIPNFNKNTLYFAFVLLITICPVLVGFILKANDHLITSIENLGINQWYVWGALTIIFFIEIFGRSYIFNKEKVRLGWEWFLAFLRRGKYNSIMESRKKFHEDNFISKKGHKPTLDQFKGSTNA
jgi:hypothetical protein